MSDPIVAHIFPVISSIVTNIASFIVAFWPTITILGLTFVTVAYIYLIGLEIMMEFWGH